MILEILAAYALIQCTTAFARLIGHRRDVLHFVSKTDPRW
jgi:hypothetical protein